MIHAPDMRDIDREISERSMAGFVRRAWRHIIPDQLQWNWHIDAVCDHLEACASGDIKRLLVNVPPGTSKSTLIGVMYPAWLWGPGGQPHHRHIGASHEQGLAIRDNRMMRELVTSDWYQSIWPLGMKGDQNEKLYFENDKRGFRQACAVKSMTGRRGHCLIGDTIIETSEGPRTIESIANSAATCNVISYDIHSGKLVQRAVEAVARGSSKEIYRVRSASGRVVVCSGDHKFYTSRGYIKARFLSEGDGLVRVLRKERDQDRCGNEEVGQVSVGIGVLQSDVFHRSHERETREASQVVCDLRKAFEESGRSSLLERVSCGVVPTGWTCEACTAKGCDLRELRNCVSSICERQASVLRKRVCFGTSQDCNFRGEQPCLEQWRRQEAQATCWVATGVDQNTDKNCGSRPWHVRRLSVGQKIACASHRHEPREQHLIEPGDPVCVLSLQMARCGEVEAVSDTVAVVERLRGERNTYDIQVNGTHCFFANGILVHNCIAWDDPLSPEKAHSVTERETAIRIFSETLPTRLNDPTRSTIIVVMQRLHEGDPSGHIIASELGYEHLCIPMEFEPERRHHTSIGWTDPRTEPGELLDARRFPPEVIERDKKAMGSYAWAGQMQQRPSPLGGGILKDEWWRYYDTLPRLTHRTIYADTAQKTKEQNDWSVFQCWGKVRETGQCILIDQVRGKWEAPELLVHARAFWGKHRAETDTRLRGVLRSFKVEDKVSGTGLIQTLKREGIPMQAIQRDTDKITRALDAAPQIEAGNVLLPRTAPWLSDFLSEASAFPNGVHDDQLDPLFDAVSDLTVQSAAERMAALAS